MIDDLCKPIIDRANVNTFVETGLFMGETVATVSRWFSIKYPQFGKVIDNKDFGQVGPNPWNTPILYPVFDAVKAVDQLRSSPQIISIETNSEYVEVAKEIFRSNPNIEIVNGSSDECLEAMIQDFEKPEVVTFFYLDAHWEKYWPIKRELEILSKLERTIIVIDDFLVPGQPNWGFDLYNDVPLDISLIAPSIIDAKKCSYYFPFRSNRDNRGFIVIMKGYNKEEEAAILEGLPFEKHKPKDLKSLLGF